MKRRTLLIRALTTSTSAAIFTAVGWLMGAKTLTMGSSPPTIEGCTLVQIRAEACVGAECPEWEGDCGHDCYFFDCGTDGSFWWCRFNMQEPCCEHSNCEV
jgi:hypothetical protein